MIAQNQTKRLSGVPFWLCLAGCLILAVPLLFALLVLGESWRGKYLWEHHRHELEAKGEPVDWAAFVPPLVARGAKEYFQRAPKMSEWFVGRGMTDLSRRMAVTNFISSPKQTEIDTLAEVTVVSPETPLDPAMADLILSYRYPQVTLSTAEPDLAKRSMRDGVMPLIRMDDVPLTDAIENLAGQIKLKCEWDASIPFKRPTGDSSRRNEPSVTQRWTNVTARRALRELLAEYQLQLKPIAGTDVVRITTWTAMNQWPVCRFSSRSGSCVNCSEAHLPPGPMISAAPAWKARYRCCPGASSCTRKTSSYCHPRWFRRRVLSFRRCFRRGAASASGGPDASIAVDGCGDTLSSRAFLAIARLFRGGLSRLERPVRAGF